MSTGQARNRFVPAGLTAVAQPAAVPVAPIAVPVGKTTKAKPAKQATPVSLVAAPVAAPSLAAFTFATRGDTAPYTIVGSVDWSDPTNWGAWGLAVCPEINGWPVRVTGWDNGKIRVEPTRTYWWHGVPDSGATYWIHNSVVSCIVTDSLRRESPRCWFMLQYEGLGPDCRQRIQCNWTRPWYKTSGTHGCAAPYVMKERTIYLREEVARQRHLFAQYEPDTNLRILAESIGVSLPSMAQR